MSKSYTAADLLEKAYSLLDALEHEHARQFCERALAMDPQNGEVLECLGVIAMDLGQEEEAKSWLEKSIAVGATASAYLYLGQLHIGQESLAYYLKGLKLLMDEYQQKTTTKDEASAASGYPRKISSACCSIVEIYMSDCCFDPDAETKCQEYLRLAEEIDPTSAELLQTQASFFLSQQRVDDAREALSASVATWLPQRYLHLTAEELMNDEDDDGDNMMEDKVTAMSLDSGSATQEQPPPYPVRLSTVKLLLELQMCSLALVVLGGLQQEDDEVMELWHLYAMTYWCLGAEQCQKYASPAVDGTVVPQAQAQAQDADLAQAAVEQYVESVMEGKRALDEDVAEFWVSAKECLEDARKLHERVPCENEMLMAEIQGLYETLHSLVPSSAGEDSIDR